MFHILKNAENPHFYGFRLHTFRTADKVVRYDINNQFDFAEHPAVIQRGEKRTINICVAVPDVLHRYYPECGRPFAEPYGEDDACKLRVYHYAQSSVHRQD